MHMSGFPKSSFFILPGSVTAPITFFVISSGLSDKYIAFPSDFPIFSFPSSPFILACPDKTSFGSFNTSLPYMLLNFLTISLHCSISGNWSSPTGINSPSKHVISAAWLTG